MAGGSVDHFGMPGSWTEALTMIDSAKVRPTFQYLAANPDQRLKWIVALA